MSFPKNKKTLKKVLSGVLLATLLLTMLASCNTSSQEGASSNNENATELETEMTTSIEKLKNGNAIFYFNEIAHSLWSNGSVENNLTTNMLRSEVDEAADAGIDVFMAELYNRAPMWQSKIYSIEEHYQWFYNEFGGKGTNTTLSYVKRGGDPVKVQCEECHEKGILYVANFRMNDSHYLTESLNKDKANVFWTYKWLVENPDCYIGQSTQGLDATYMLDFANEKVRDYKLSLIYELIDNYDIDGIMLDFMRWPAFFNTTRTSESERIKIMTAFVKSVREHLDAKTAKTGKQLFLGVNLPTEDKQYGNLGLDIERLYIGAKVDYFMYFEHYFTCQTVSMISKTKRICPDALVYFTISHAVATLNNTGYQEWRYATDEEIYTTAYLAYKEGANGIALHNWPFYVSWSGNADYKIPWSLVKELKDPTLLATKPQHYFLGTSWKVLNYTNILSDVEYAPGVSANFTMTFQQPTGGWTTDGVFRIESMTDLTGAKFEVYINNQKLSTTVVTQEPYTSPYRIMLLKENNWLSFIVPKELLKNGSNKVTIKMVSGENCKLYFADLAIK